MFLSSSFCKTPIYSKLLIGALTALMLVTVSGCKKDRDIDDGRSAEEMYTTAKGYLDNQNWGRAVNGYQTLATRYPFGRYTEQAQLELAYAYH